MKYIYILILQLLPLVAHADKNGSCGKYGSNVSYTFFEETKTLVISGEGEMKNYTNLGGPLAPWFNYANKITSVVIEQGVTSIGNCSFWQCNKITSVSISSSVTSIGKSAFLNCNELTYITIPNSVTLIGESAFSMCSSLTSLTIPSNVTFIGSEAFASCSSLTNIIIESKNTIYDSRNNCNAIIETSTNTIIAGCKNTLIPNSVTSISSGAFRGCNGLTSFTLPNSLTAIGKYAFLGCNGLTSITIPNSVSFIGDGAFAFCRGLTSIKVESENTVYDSRDNCNAIIETSTNTIIAGCKNAFIPNSVTSIGNYAFQACEGLTFITIPSSVTSIGNYAFEYCSGLNSFTIPSSVTFIGNSAFYQCSILENVISKISVPFNISQNVFSGISSDAILTVPKGAKSRYKELNGWTTDFKEIIEDAYEDISNITADDLNYTVTSQTNNTVNLMNGGSGLVLTVPATITQNGTTWKVTGIDNNALKDNTELAAIIWNPEAAFTATVSNPNLLLYAKSAQYAPSTIKNVVVNGTANSITLTDAASGNNFYCPEAFTAQKISYSHHYTMMTGIGESRGWETIALPFDVQKIEHASKGTIVPFTQWRSGDTTKPFWLYELKSNGFVEASSIKANTPYIISMPNNPQYADQYQLVGNVTFSSENITISKSDNLQQPKYSDRTFVPNFQVKESDRGTYALNVNNDYVTNDTGMTEGSKFVMNMRKVHPFEAYMMTSSTNAPEFFDVFEGMTTDISELELMSTAGNESVYDLQGRRIIKNHLSKGIYIVNGQKIIIK